MKKSYHVRTNKGTFSTNQKPHFGTYPNGKTKPTGKLPDGTTVYRDVNALKHKD